MKRPESKGRERALLSAYAREMDGNFSESLIEEEGEISKEGEELYKLLINGVVEKQTELDSIISGYLRKWSMERLMAIDRCILRLAVYEMLYYKNTPIKVVLDEYIELAKKYGDTNSRSFVNAVLDSINKDYNKG